MKHQTTGIAFAWAVLLIAIASLALPLLAVFLEPVREVAGDLSRTLVVLVLTLIVYGNVKRLRALEARR